MKKSILIYIILSFSFVSSALQGTENLEKKLFAGNQDLNSIQQMVNSKGALSSASNSGFYPTLNAVGGWGQNKTDALTEPEKGYLGYLEGRVNFFRGFKDSAISEQREIDLQIAELDLERKKRQLRLEFTEILSDLILIHEFQSILSEEYKTTQSQKQMASKKVSAGLTGSVDNLEMDLRESEIKIEQLQMNQRHIEAHQNLFKIFGSNIEDSEVDRISFNRIDSFSKLNPKIEIENSIEYKRALLTENRAGTEKKEIRSDFMPSLDFYYNLGRLTPSEEKPIKFNEYRYGVLLTIPLFSGFDTYYKTKAANFHQASAGKLKLQKRIEIETDYKILKERMMALRTLAQLNESKLLQAQKYFDSTLSEYRRGIKNSPDVVGATERFFSAKKKKYEILKDLELTQLKIDNLF